MAPPAQAPGSSATRWRTRTGPRSTTPTCSCAAWSATARPRRGPSRPAGTRTSSSTRWGDGAVLPVLHLNGYKIANPTILARISRGELRSLLEGYGYAPRFLQGSEPEEMHQGMAALLDEVMDEIASIQRAARAGETDGRPRWPMIVLVTPKGLDGPYDVLGGHARPRALVARRRAPQRRRAQFPQRRPRRNAVQPARRGLRGHRARVGSSHRGRRRAPGPRRPRDRGALRAPLPGLPRGLPAHRPARPLQTATRPSSTSSTPRSTSTPSG